MTRGQARTLLEALVASLRSCDSAADGVERPAAILWTDPERQWQALVTDLLEELPELLVLGEYEPGSRTGPAIWMRCVVDGALEEPALPEDRIPILYLPGVGRQMLRAGEDCPPELRPLVELLYRGTVWKHPNGQDWTVTAFLGQRGIGLDVARDEDTRRAVLRALRELAKTSLAALRGRHLDAEDFDRLLTADVVRDLLRWMGDPEGARSGMDPKAWEAFRNQAKARFGFDPGEEGELVAGEKLVAGGGAWDDLWQRYTEAPNAYSGVRELLARVQPPDLYSGADRLPQENARAEQELRDALTELGHRAPNDVRARILELEESHGPRRRWVWARLKESPLALALEPLCRLAERTRRPLGGSTPSDFATAYAEEAWRADEAAWAALAAVRSAAEQEVVGAVVRTLLLPWLDDSARAFQEVVGRQGLGGEDQAGGVQVEEGVCLIFADGLRFDLARRLAERLEAEDCRARLDWRWAGLPTVTATGKPWVSPAAADLRGGELGGDFAPGFLEGGRPYAALALRRAIAEHGYQILEETALGEPQAEGARAWTECGDVDNHGHEDQDRLPERIGVELDRLAERIRSLLEAGWREVRVVTDHGWLWAPGGLPRVDLPLHLTESRWARCAALQGNPEVTAPLFPWSWNPRQLFATAPGAACFNRTTSYAHGGVSIQECLTPVLAVAFAGGAPVSVAIRSVTWRGMRCLVEADGPDKEILVDLRAGSSHGDSVAAAIKPLVGGATNLLVADDDYENADLVLVLIGEGNRILAQRRTRVGENS
ncbi:MAG: BREX-1 system phosphatase PglZ type B [Planctomycetota bacterium]|nr:MAG: BREX-1 system phosphatase PglZ type B [Planctomycetota bacterium]